MMWRVAVGCWFMALVGTALPANAQVAVAAGDYTFTWAQVAVLVGIGAAWGDMRAQMGALKERVSRIESRSSSKGGSQS